VKPRKDIEKYIPWNNNTAVRGKEKKRIVYRESQRIM
jgi:hypothetical protein